ncbi:MAG: hypothetical protein RLZZ480_505 [Candidatus Parcubacteria bacterium]
MSAWDALFKFEEHEICLVGQVWQELDNHKKGHSPEAWNVRQAIRAVDRLLVGKTPTEIRNGILLTPPPELINGKPHTGKLFFDFSKPAITDENDTCLDLDNPDDRIILVCLALKKQGKRVVLVSNDGSCRIKAAVVGIDAEEYLGDTVATIQGEEDLSPGFHIMSKDFWDQCGDLSVKENGVTTYTIKHDDLTKVACNEFLVIPDIGSVRVVEKPSADCVVAETFSHFDEIRKIGFKAKNIEQEFAMQLLLDTNLPAVSLAGKAGSGKTYLTLAAGLYLVHEAGIYKRIIFTRSTLGSDEDIGFVPGDERDKMSPWMGALWDNLEALNKEKVDGYGKKKSSETKNPVEDLIQIKALNFMKGRSIADTLIIVDETQDLTVKKLRMISTRVGAGSKIVFLGNVAQIDDPYLTEHTCGLSVLIRSLRDSPLIGHITLQSGERSPFATLAEERL